MRDRTFAATDLDDEFPRMVFVAYRNANLRYPQTDMGVIPIVSAALLSSDLPTLRLGLTRSFTPAQKNVLKRAMDSVHRAFAVPVFSEKFAKTECVTAGAKIVDDDRLDVLWINIASFIAVGMQQFLLATGLGAQCLRPEAMDCHAAFVAMLIQALTADPMAHARLLSVFGKMKSVLHGREALDRSNEYRRAIREASAKLHKDLAALRMRFEGDLATLLAEGVRSQFPEIAQLIDRREWIVARRLGRLSVVGT